MYPPVLCMRPADTEAAFLACPSAISSHSATSRAPWRGDLKTMNMFIKFQNFSGCTLHTNPKERWQGTVDIRTAGICTKILRWPSSSHADVYKVSCQSFTPDKYLTDG